MKKSRWPFALIGLASFFFLAFVFQFGQTIIPSNSGSAKQTAADGPGLPNRSYPPQDVLTVIAKIDASNSAPRAHGTVAMHKGWLVIIYSDDGEANGGFSFYDFSVSNTPVLVGRKDDAETHDLREAHGYGFSSSYGRDLVALQAALGIQIWDWTEVKNPVRLSYLHLPGIEDSNYALGAWWLCWQAPYIYVGGSGNGIYIVEASDPRNPVLVNRGNGRPNPIPISQTGGFRVGPIFAVGNVLAASSMEESGYVTMDISDPINPALLAAQTSNMPPVYSSLLNGNKILGVDIYNNFTVFDISDPTRFRYENGISLKGRGGYVTFQDGFAHAGASEHYFKIDMRDPARYEYAGPASSGIEGRDEDFATVMGNLVLVSDDHGNGTFIIPHQAEPDDNPPAVNMISPNDRSLHQALTSRVGMTFTDQIDLRSVNESSFILRPAGSSAALRGKYSSQTGIVNFSPEQPLLPNTAYEVVLPANGIRDLAGNAMATAFRSTFSTGASLLPQLQCELVANAPAIVGANVTLRASSRNAAGTVQYSFDFGDGSQATPFSTNANAAHVYAQPGHYLVQVTAKDSVRTSRASTFQTIHHALTARAPVSSSTMVWDEAKQLVWNVNTDNATVTAIDALLLNKKMEARVGKEPRTLAQAPDATIWVVNQGVSTISILDSKNGNLVHTIALPHGSRPFGIVFSANAAYVTLQATSRLLKIDPNTRTILADLVVGPTPRGLAISHDGERIFVTRFVSPNDHAEVVEVNATNFTVTRTFNLALDPGPDTESSGRGVPNYLSGIRIAPDGRRAWIASKKDNVQRGVQRDGLPLTFESTVRTMVSQLDLINNVEDLSARRDLNDRDMASAVAFSPLGDYAFVAVQGSNTIDVLDAYSRALITSIENVGLAPQGLAMSGDGSKLFVQNFMSRTVAVYAVSEIAANGSNQVRKLAEIVAVSNEALAPNVLLGKQIFYNASDRRMNRDGYLSCASCHIDGEHDGRVWDFSDRGEGWRNTISLRGRRGLAQGRLHWSANFDEVQDFEHDIRNAFGGAGFMNEADFNTGTRNHPLGERKAGVSAELDALAAYLESLAETPASPYRNADGSLTSKARLGRFIFQKQKCARCHGGNEFTDSPAGVRHDVGTLKATSGKRLGEPLLGLDTPTLRGVWSTAPYLHDGSAATLMDVLTNASAAHGDLPRLNLHEHELLATYLAQIDDGEPAISNDPPPIELAAPLAQNNFLRDNVVLLCAQTPSHDEDLVAVEFYSNEKKIGEASAAPFQIEWRNAPRGANTITTRARHRNGAVTFGKPIEFDLSAASERSVLRDSLFNSTKAKRTGGQFAGNGGWQVTGANDMLVYDLGAYVSNGALEFELRNFQPSRQNALERHHFVSMYRNPWGNHHPAENLETVWNLHSGFYYNPGVKLLSWTYDENEQNNVNKNEWEQGRTYQIKVEWSGKQVSYYRDGELQATNTHSDEMQLRYLFVGRDFTVSGDLLTNYSGNQYPAMTGPIFSNIVVKAQTAGNDALAPQIVNVATSEVYANGARLRWSTSEAATSLVEYGLTTNYGQRTPVLGLPAKDFSTALANLEAEQVYHYRLVASDSAGNVSTSADQTFTTRRSGAYIFKPSADTFVERAGLKGTKRDNANFGWMSLLASEGRECYLRFEMNEIKGNVTSAKLRLHGRRAGNSGVSVRVLNDIWKEPSTTWLNKPVVNGKTLGAIASVRAEQWHEVRVDSVINTAGAYNFALIGAGSELVSFDSRESPNQQPELIINTIDKPVALYEMHEVTLRASNVSANAYLSGPEVVVTFTGASGNAAGKSATVKGFWDGDSTYRVRFAPNAMGEWAWSSSSNNSGLNNKSGRFTCEGILPEQHAARHGHVRESKSSPYTFAHEDSTPFFLIGDTQWSFGNGAIAWPEEFQTYVNARAAQGFNYVHGVVYQTFPTGRAQNEGGEAFLNNDVDRLDPGFWRAFDQRVAYMNEKGIVAGLMFAWANNAWRKFNTTAQVERFVQYLVNRYAAYNVFWITAGEYEETSPPGGHSFVGELLQARDPYRHPITTHTLETSADDFGNAAWHTTIYQQTSIISLITQDRKYNKPVINSEFGYEGDQSADEVRKDAWEIVMRGGFLVYGDTTTYHYGASMTTANLYSEGAGYMTALKKFWTTSGAKWWQFAQFEELGNRRWLAARTGFEHVVYVENANAFNIDLSALPGEVRGRWFDTKTGQWGAAIAGNASVSFLLTPPRAGFVAYLVSANDNDAPSISNVLVTNRAASSVVIAWSTDEVADTQVEYSFTRGYGLKSQLDTTRALSHRAVLTGLAANATYHFRVLSRDARGNLGTSADSVFRTNGRNTRNVAQFAHASASSENVRFKQTADKAIDGFVEGYPFDQTREWAALAESHNAWLQLDFAEPITIEHVVLYDRPNLSDHVLGADLNFSDGSNLKVGALVNEGGAFVLTFSPRTVSWLRFNITNSRGQNSGLAEIEVWEEGSFDTSRASSDGDFSGVFALSNAYPNPFNLETRMFVDLPSDGHCRAMVYNIIGQEVVRLADEEVRAGRHGLVWYGKNQQGGDAGTGIYLVRVQYVASSSVRTIATRRVLLMK